MVKWLSVCAPKAGGLGTIPGQATRSHMSQLRACVPQLKVPHAATKIKDPEGHSQINKYFKKIIL